MKRLLAICLLLVSCMKIQTNNTSITNNTYVDKWYLDSTYNYTSVILTSNVVELCYICKKDTIEKITISEKQIPVNRLIPIYSEMLSIPIKDFQELVLCKSLEDRIGDYTIFGNGIKVRWRFYDKQIVNNTSLDK